MKQLLLAIVVSLAAYAGYAAPAQETSSLATAYAGHLRHVRVQDQGQVIKVLPDDKDGSRHQRFLVRLASGQTILIAHNIDIAPRLPSLSAKDLVEFNGIYEWNQKGGVVHWTHRDPSGRRAAGWIRHKGQSYQ